MDHYSGPARQLIRLRSERRSEPDLPPRSGCSLGDKPESVLLADLLGRRGELSPPPSVFAGYACTLAARAAETVGAAAPGAAARHCAAEALSEQPLSGASLAGERDYRVLMCANSEPWQCVQGALAQRHLAGHL